MLYQQSVKECIGHFQFSSPFINLLARFVGVLAKEWPLTGIISELWID